MSEQPKTVGGLEPVICENADGTCWISGGNFRELCSDGTWVGLDKSGSVWPTREVAQRFIDRHADQPPSGKDSVQDDKKPCLCNGICLGKEQLRSNRVCQLDLLLPAVPQVKDLSEQPKPTTADQPPSGKDLPDEPWAWAVVDPNGRLRDKHGNGVDTIICWDKEDAQSFRDQYAQFTEIGEDDPRIVELFPAVPQEATNWKQRAEKAEAELAVAKINTNHMLCKAVDEFMNECLVAIAGAVSTPERGYIEDGGLQLLLSDIKRLRKQHDQQRQRNGVVAQQVEQRDLKIHDITQQLTAAKERLAKVREALTRLAKWTNLSLFSKTILAEAQAALAEGEG